MNTTVYLKAMFLLAFYFIPLILWAIYNHNKYKNSRLQASAITKGIHFQHKYQILKRLNPKESA